MLLLHQFNIISEKNCMHLPAYDRPFEGSAVFVMCAHTQAYHGLGPPYLVKPANTLPLDGLPSTIQNTSCNFKEEGSNSLQLLVEWARSGSGFLLLTVDGLVHRLRLQPVLQCIERMAYQRDGYATYSRKSTVRARLPFSYIVIPVMRLTARAGKHVLG